MPLATSDTFAAASLSASSLFSSLATSRKNRASSRSVRCFSHVPITSFSADCSLKSACALSLSFQKSGFDVTSVSSSTRLRFVSRSKTPPEHVQALFEVGKLFCGFFQHDNFSILLPCSQALLSDGCRIETVRLERGGRA